MIRLIRQAALAAVFALAAGISSAGEAVPHIPLEKYTLDNGLEVILVEDKRLPLTAVNIWYKVGAANEEPGLTGFAHLFEHMMFAATKHVPRGMADRLIESVGGVDSNGTTSPDRTNYFDTVPAHQLELALWIHADRMGYLLDVLDQEALSNQQDVVRNERRQRVENQPYGLVQEAVWQALFPREHPYHADVIGSHADIQNARLGDIKRFFKKYYRPNNASLTIVGDIDKAATKALVQKYFGSFARGEALTPLKLVQPALREEKRVTVSDRVELAKVIIAWHTPATYADGDADLSLLGQLLAGGKSSRLYRSLVYQQQIAQEVQAFQYSMKQGSIFWIEATAKPGVTPQRLEAALDHELARLRKTPVALHELARARNVYETDLIASLQKRGGWGLAERLSHYNYFAGTPDYLGEELAKLRAVTPESIRRNVQQYLGKSQRAVVYGVPGPKNLGPEVPATKPGAGEATEALNPAQAWRATPPLATADPRIQLPQPTSFKLANGLTVIHHREAQLPLVSASVVVKAGTEANPPDRPGLASFTAALLEEGTRSRSSRQIADQLAALGAPLSLTTGSEATSAAVLALKRNADAALAIVADVIQAPAFAQAEVDRLKKRRLADIALNRSNPQALAALASAAALYGARHPFGYPDIGTETSIKALSRTDVQRFWRDTFTPDNAALVLVGDLSQEEARRLAERHFGRWPPRPGVVRRIEERTVTPAQLVVVHVPDAPQSAIRVVADGPTAIHPDLPAVEVMNAAFGGLFTSRVNDLLREQKGYTYGTYSRLDSRRHSGHIAIRGSIRADVTGAALSDVLGEIDGMHTRPVAADEFRKGRNASLLSLPGQFETLGSMGGAFGQLFAVGLPLDYFISYPGKVSAVSESDVAGMVRRYLKRDAFKVIVAGDRKVIDTQLSTLKLAPVEYRSVDGSVTR
jgi:zinc protease